MCRSRCNRHNSITHIKAIYFFFTGRAESVGRYGTAGDERMILCVAYDCEANRYAFWFQNTKIILPTLCEREKNQRNFCACGGQSWAWWITTFIMKCLAVKRQTLNLNYKPFFIFFFFVQTANNFSGLVHEATLGARHVLVFPCSDVI